MNGEFNRDEGLEGMEPLVARTSGGRVVIFGTAHGEQKFIDLVDRFIRMEHPDLVLVELEHLTFSVWNSLVDEYVGSTTDMEIATFLDWRSTIASKIREKRFQLPKGEMIQAIQTSKVVSIPWEIIDMQIEKIARAAGALELELESLAVDNLQRVHGDFLELYFETAVRFAQFAGLINTKKAEDPTAGERVLDARDEYMAQKITSSLNEPSYRKILIVCGSAHVPPYFHSLARINVRSSLISFHLF